MRLRANYMIPVVAVVGAIVAMELLLPKPISWVVSLSSDDKIPYGTYVLKESIGDLFLNPPAINRSTFYESEDSLPANYFIVATRFGSDREDLKALLKRIEEGSNALISASGYTDVLLDTFNLKTTDAILKELRKSADLIENDSGYLQSQYGDRSKFYYKNRDIALGFDLGDSTSWQTYVLNDQNKPVLIGRQFGEGRLYLSTTPLIFTNYYLLHPRNHLLAANSLSILPAEVPLTWSEYYSRGRGEPQTPLRYILSAPALKWAYYVLVIALIIFVFVDSKRQQRPIPVLRPPQNDSVNFIKTLGNLYFERRDHKNIFIKKIGHLHDHIRTHYRMDPRKPADDFTQVLSAKSGKPLLNIEGLFTMISILEKKDKIDDDELFTLNKKMEAFLKN